MYLLRLNLIMFFVLMTGSAFAESRLKEFISLHNLERESLGLPELEWSEELQESAQLLTKTMAFKDKHEGGNTSYGENSWSGENNGATFEEIFKLWSAGKDYFLADQPVPLSCSKAWDQCSGYSQIVWSNTTHIGCAAAASMENDYIVCHYSPAGNIQDQKAY